MYKHLPPAARIPLWGLLLSASMTVYQSQSILREQVNVACAQPEPRNRLELPNGWDAAKARRRQRAGGKADKTTARSWYAERPVPSCRASFCPHDSAVGYDTRVDRDRTAIHDYSAGVYY